MTVGLKWIKKITKIIVITIISLLLLLFLLPYIMPGTISKKIKTLVNRSIEGEVNFSQARLSFFNHFPALTLTLHDFTMKGSAPFQNDTLLSAGDIAFGIDIPALIGGNITIDQFFLTRANINVEVNENGDANYNVYKAGGAPDSSASEPDTTTALKIERIVIEKSNLRYDDRSSGILINAQGLDYSGSGDLSKAIFDLGSQLEIDSFDFYYNHQPYILNKLVQADLITSINTNSLALLFKENDLHINKLPVRFTGKFEFLSKGYNMDFRLKSEDTDLEDVFSVLPPSYQGWLKQTKIKGDATINASLAGRYITGTDTMPDLSFDMKVRKGYIAYEKSPTPVSNLYLDFSSEVRSLNPDSLSLNVDSLFLNVDKGYFTSVLQLKGFSMPYIFTRTNASIDLENLDLALGLHAVDLKGTLDLSLLANGQYSVGQNPKRLRRDIITTSIPAFTLSSSLKNGYLKFNQLSQPIQQINFNALASCPDHDYRHLNAAVENIDVKALNNYIAGFFRVKNADNFPIDASLDALFRLSDIKQFCPLDSLELNGTLTMKIRSSGNYQPIKGIFPKTEAAVKIDNGSVKTKYYPAPIEKIAVDLTMKNKLGTLSDLVVSAQPISFEFEGNPFVVKADLTNFDNIVYDITSKGKLDLGRIYHVFAYEGWDVKGVIETDLSLKGNQADAAAGRFSRLNNSGTLKVNQIIIHSDLYPLPFIVDKGVFRFQKDQLRFEDLRTTYGRSSVTLNGTVSNVFDYVAENGPLKGDLRLSSDHLFLNELMAYNADSTSARPDSMKSTSSGVIMIPGNLDMRFAADVKNVDYNKLEVKDVKGEVVIKDAMLQMNKTGFTIADAVTVMDASYKSLSPARALFSYHVEMNDFDVKKMYEQVELFRELAPAAEKAQGIISLNYDLGGKLDGEMYPIMPSLKGGGVLSVKQVKMKEFKLFSGMSKETGKSEINDPDLSKINFKTTIKNNVVTLEKTKMKVAGFRLRIQGQTNFDGMVKFKCRLGLPPFGIVGIPMNITGPGQNPKIKVGKSDELPLEERQEEMDDKAN